MMSPGSGGMNKLTQRSASTGNSGVDDEVDAGPLCRFDRLYAAYREVSEFLSSNRGMDLRCRKQALLKTSWTRSSFPRLVI